MYILSKDRVQLSPFFASWKIWIPSFKFTTKSATVICAVGISFGLGGFILYKLYCRFIQPFFKKPPKKKKSNTRNANRESPKSVDGSGGEKTMGNSNSNRPETSAYFSPKTGVNLHVGRKSRSKDNLQAESSNNRTKRRVKRRKTSADSDMTKSVPVKVPSSSSSISTSRLVHSASDVSNIDLDGSMKANVSLQSLCDRNIKELEKLKREDELNDDQGQEQFPQVNVQTRLESQSDNLSNKENVADSSYSQADSSSKFHIELSDDLLTVSSVLLTPPSEDDGQGRLDQFRNHSHLSVLCDHDQQHPLSSSDCHTDSKNGADESCSCDERDSVASLPKLRSPDRFFRESLRHRLQECQNGAGSSNSSSLDSSPDFSPYARNRKYSIETDSLSCLSGIATPDSEIFNLDVDNGTEDQFDHLEEEVLDIEQEFASLANKLNELKNIALKSEGSSIEYSPSHPLAKKAVEIVDRTRSRLSRSRSVSVSSTDSSPAHSIDMPDLSWDSEGLHANNSSHHGNSINKVTPNSRRCSEPGGAIRNKLHAKYLFRNSNGHSSINYDSPIESDLERDGTLDNLSTDECFDLQNLSDWASSDCNPVSQNKPKSSTDGSDSKESLPVRDSASVDASSQNVSSSENPSNVSSSQNENNSADPMNADGKSDMSSASCSSDIFESARETNSDPRPNSSKEEDCQCPNVNLESNNNGTVQVSKKMAIPDYVKSEWKGHTERASTIRKAYEEIPKQTGCNYLCRIRGDNYCGIRGTLFQCLRTGIDITKRWSDYCTITELTKKYAEGSSGLKLWSFARRLSCMEGQQLSLMRQCLSLLFSKFEEARSIESQKERENWTINLLNSDHSCDLYLMEGIKLLMLLNVLDLKQKQERGDDVPIFVWLLFARDTSETPQQFVKNHLNALGDSGGIEQVEMFLLGHTLGVRVQVLRLSQFGQEDFIVYYPDETDNNWSQVSLIAEDDRHYNVPVP